MSAPIDHAQQFAAARSHQDREERRPADLSGWFIRSLDESVWDFCITDLSYAGCRIHTGAPLHRGEAVRLAVQKRGNINATVRWRRGEFAGLSFDEVQPKPKHWPRKSDRHAFNCTVLVRRHGRRSQMIDARDVSRHGCCLNFVDPPSTGETVWVRLGNLAAIEAEVRWTKGFNCGVSFTSPIHSAVFDLLLSPSALQSQVAASSARLRY